MAIKEPVVFCAPWDPIQINAGVRLPFGLPRLHYDAACTGLELPNIQFILPFFRLAECALKVITFVQTIPDAISPPQPWKIVTELSKLVDCANLILNFFLPIQPFCLLLKDLLRFLVTLLTCIQSTFSVYVASEQESAILQISVDPNLVSTGQCLADQNLGLLAEIQARLDGVSTLIELVNLFSSVFPMFNLPVIPTDFTGASLSTFDDRIAQLNDAIAVLEAICPG